MRTRICAFRLSERLHDDRELVRGNAFAIVLHHDVHALGGSLQPYLDQIAFARELHRVRDEIDDHLPQSHLVHAHQEILVASYTKLLARVPIATAKYGQCLLTTSPSRMRRSSSSILPDSIRAMSRTLFRTARRWRPPCAISPAYSSVFAGCIRPPSMSSENPMM